MGALRSRAGRDCAAAPCEVVERGSQLVAVCTGHPACRHVNRLDGRLLAPDSRCAQHAWVRVRVRMATASTASGCAAANAS